MNEEIINEEYSKECKAICDRLCKSNKVIDAANKLTIILAMFVMNIEGSDKKEKIEFICSEALKLVKLYEEKYEHASS